MNRSIVDETGGFIKIVTEDDGTIIGASIVGSRAGELIHEVALANQEESKAEAV